MNNQEKDTNEPKKKCSKCNNYKLLTNFHKCKAFKDGLSYTCKDCNKIRNKDPRKREYDKKYSKEHYKNPENKEKKKQYGKEYEKLHPEKRKIWHKKFRNSNKGKEYNLNYKRKEYKEKYGKDVKWTLLLMLRNRLKNALINHFKSGKTLELLGCSIEDFKIHLEKLFDENMNWENRGKYWEIDHIKPCSKFDLSLPEEQQKCFHYTNLQPLEKIQNRIKSDKYE